ncbi:MAG: hypothetical protein M3384_02505 [Acidobacteriota bacterium]|nr:hypothetical protein [Acidobacteriota bacterium]
MKKMFMRIMTLSVLVMATFWFGGERQQAKRWGCAERMFAAQSACDDAMSSTWFSYQNVTNYTPNQCHTQAYNQCVYSTNPNCEPDAYVACYNTTVNNYDNRYVTYGNCVGGTIDYTCYEEPDFCSAARERANQCAALYPYEPGTINTALMDCRNASGIDRCQ